MPKNLPVFLIALITILSVSLLIYFKDPPKKDNYKPGVFKQEDTAVNQAKHLFEQRKDAGDDFSSGPCLTNALMPGWVVDIAHSPRQPIDDLPENQCSAFIEGSATHFVELDIEGNIIRVK